jgi:hypothetical protein
LHHAAVWKLGGLAAERFRAKRAHPIPSEMRSISLR